ncbi:type II secretion system F family protein [Alisedimentitalea sp. MJ-SS2]|uniref:type II secretion system F family protein n=1 Tax=Aliisedimentitalea sp. MJ-SS2 TaxID=3049795 RepID=UPI0029154F8A|nr:type II secretion system F family protein [Alisedimentitalea sp. MJ-SS2]MDU8928270.1 type II secretion system F family protein [Alisedimentitalea sp. MJ-SS2]
MLSSPTVIYGLVFAAVLLLVASLLRLVFSSRRSAADVKNRLEALKLDHGAEAAYTNLLLRRGINRGADDADFIAKLRRYYSQSGLELPVTRRVIILTLLWIVGYVVGVAVLKLVPFLAMPFAFVFMVTLASLAVYRLRARRIAKFTSQLAPGIDIIVRSLNAGHPLNAAISLLAREMSDPIGSEFGILSDQMTFGSDLDQAMLNMIDRVGAPELNLLAITVSVQRGTGGNLSEILENLAQMIRDRMMIKAKIRAISAEGRFTAWVMMLFPFVLFTMIRTLVPTYFDEVWESGYGEIIVTGCLMFMLFGFLIVRKLVNFDF